MATCAATAGKARTRWALDIAGVLAGERIWGNTLFSARYGWLEHIASYDAGLRRGGLPATAQEYRLRSLLAHAAGASGHRRAGRAGGR